MALRRELDEKVQEKDEQIRACEMEVKKLLQQSLKKISELEAWKKTIKDKTASLASAAEQQVEDTDQLLQKLFRNQYTRRFDFNF